MAENKNEDKTTEGVEDQPRETPDGDMVVRTIGRDFRVEGNNVDGYVGVTSEYRNYANDTEKPYVTEEEVALFLRTGIMTDVEVMTAQEAARNVKPETATDEDDKDKKSDEDDKDDKPKSTGTQGHLLGSKAPASKASTSTSASSK